jgi:hypothetical protein
VADHGVLALLATRTRDMVRLVCARSADLTVEANTLLQSVCEQLGGRRRQTRVRARQWHACGRVGRRDGASRSITDGVKCACQRENSGRTLVVVASSLPYPIREATMSAERQAVFQDLGDTVDRLCTLDLRPAGPTSGYIGRFYQAVRALTDAPLALTAAQCCTRSPHRAPLLSLRVFAIRNAYRMAKRTVLQAQRPWHGPCAVVWHACRSSSVRPLLRHLCRPVSSVWVYTSTGNSRPPARTPAESPSKPFQLRPQRRGQRRTNS